MKLMYMTHYSLPITGRGYGKKEQLSYIRDPANTRSRIQKGDIIRLKMSLIHSPFRDVLPRMS